MFLFRSHQNLVKNSKISTKYTWYLYFTWRLPHTITADYHWLLLQKCRLAALPQKCRSAISWSGTKVILVFFMEKLKWFELKHSFSLIESAWSRKSSYFWRSMLKGNAWIRTTVVSPVRFHCATLLLIISLKNCKLIQIR